MTTTISARTAEPASGEMTGEDWTAEELEAVRARLERGAARLHAAIDATQLRIADPQTPLRAGGAGDAMAFATHAAELEQQLRTLDGIDAVLAQTERALCRLAAGSYPRCEACGHDVGKARQHAIPRAVTCLRCQQRRDRRAGL